MEKVVYIITSNDLGDVEIIGVYQNRQDAINERIRLELDIKHWDVTYIIQEYILK